MSGQSIFVYPCPLCGALPEIHAYTKEEASRWMLEYPAFLAFCPNLSSGGLYHSYGQENAKTIDDAIISWNRGIEERLDDIMKYEADEITELGRITCETIKARMAEGVKYGVQQ